MEPLSITAMKNANLATIDRDELVDIRDVKVNTSLPKRERAIDFIRQIGNPYCYKHGKYVVKVGFSVLKPEALYNRLCKSAFFKHKRHVIQRIRIGIFNYAVA